jgi:ABC-type transporter Mla subunit MlaD
MRAVASRDKQLGQTIDELPETLRVLQSASATIGETSGRSAPVLRSLASSITALRPGITRLTVHRRPPLAFSARPKLRRSPSRGR